MVGIRRGNARSDDSGSGYTSGSSTSSTIEEWVARKDLFRMVAHGLPMTMPVTIKRADSRLEAVYTQHVEPRIAQILGKHGISYFLIRFDYWHPKYEEEHGEPTVLVDSRDTDTGAWPAAAREIHSVLRDHLGNQTRLQVEICNREKYYNDVSRRFPDDPQLLEAMAKIEPEVINAVCSFLGGSWSSIAYHTRVHREANYDSPGKPTIIVFCYPGSTCDYDKAEDQLLQVLKAVSPEIHLEFLPGEISPSMRLSPGPLSMHDIPKKPCNGASIGAEGNTSEAGSLGGWVVLNLPRQRQTIPCAITCYHVVKSPDASVAEHTNKHGVMLDDPRGHVTVEYPATYDAAYTLSRFDKICSRNSDDAEAVKVRQNLTTRFSNRGVGNVILASGYRNKNDHRSDWALVESPSTYSAHKPPPKEAIGPPFQLPEFSSYTQNSDSKVRGFGRAKLGDWVTKIGRTTGCTSAEINHMYRAVPGPQGMVTHQVEILSHRGNFAEPGDSGSMVTGERGEFLGLVVSIDKFSGSFNPAFITTIQQIQEDVKEFTGGGFLSVD